MDVSPFDLGGRGDAAVLCLHGLTGTPYEVRPLGEAFAERGHRAVGPVLPGHNSSPAKLAAVSHTTWLDCTRVELTQLRREHERVFVSGLSLGGLLALAVASEGSVDGLVVVGTPLRLRGALAAWVPLAKHLVPYVRKPGGSDIQDEAARRRHPSYPVMPLRSVHELMRLQRRVRAALGRVRAPIFVAHGAQDRTAHPDDAQEIVESVSSPEREHLLLASSGHIVPVDRDGARLAAAAATFLVRCASARKARAQ